MLGLKIVVERGSGVPLFKQLIDQLRTAIMRGEISRAQGFLPSESFRSCSG